MNELPCEVVRDLLPSYVDGLTSETTNRLVGEHVDSCASCRAALDAMRAPEERAEDESADREIDYLKKNRRRNRAMVLWSLTGALLLAFTVLFLRLFVIGEELSYGSVVPRNIVVDGNHLTAQLDCLDSARVIKAVYYEEKDGVVTLRARGVLVSFLFGPGARADYTASAPIRQVRMPERIYWADGEAIGKLASDVYLTRHDYVGDMSANGATANAIGISDHFGPYENELQTSKQPYGWTLRLKSDIPEDKRAYLEGEMRASAYVLLAVVGNLDEVCFAYTVDGAAEELTVTADDAAAFFGQEVKTCYESPRLLDDLIRKTELRSPV